ncbi:hypothetical protein ANO14919_087040 [Xylariales sp. No.14919]|nr:hypothetical protein F5X98DRAFT_129326 [Xylaria grammica]GAW19219.1 hypothetical protein ANO14919_087040 [Xylariales sp. No.14919]
MSYDPISYLGLSCPSGGDFYICQDNEVRRFLGCCDIDPCGRNQGDCPSSALHPASFNADRYNDIPAQSCVSSTKDPLWYLCTNGPTFLGCCVTNPCDNEGVCQEDSLAGATLNDNPKMASVFLTATATVIPTSTSSTDRSASTTTSMVIPVTQIPNSDLNNKNNSAAPIGAIVGGIVGSIAVLGLVVLICFLCRRRRKRLATPQSNEGAMATSLPPWGPYHHSSNRSSGASTFAKRLSISLGSIIRLKRQSTGKRSRFRVSAGREAIDANLAHVRYGNGQANQDFLSPVAELEGPPLGDMLVQRQLHDTIYYEVEGSVPKRSG